MSQQDWSCLFKALFHLFKFEDGPIYMALYSPQALATLAFKEMELNNDGKVTKESFVRACLSEQSISEMIAVKVTDVIYDALDYFLFQDHRFGY